DPAPDEASPWRRQRLITPRENPPELKELHSVPPLSRIVKLGSKFPLVGTGPAKLTLVPSEYVHAVRSALSAPTPLGMHSCRRPALRFQHWFGSLKDSHLKSGRPPSLPSAALSPSAALLASTFAPPSPHPSASAVIRKRRAGQASRMKSYGE